MEPEELPVKKIEVHIWTDLETTGLDENNGEILEVSIRPMIPEFMTDLLDMKKITGEGPSDPYFTEVVKPSKDFHKYLNEWTLRQHSRSGLIVDCLDAKRTIDIIDSEISTILEDIYQDVVDRAQRAYSDPIIIKIESKLAGSSIDFDRRWIKKHMPGFYSMISSHRVVDVTSQLSLFKSAGFDISEFKPEIPEELAHRSQADISSSISAFVNMRDFLKDCLANEEHSE